MRYRKKNKGLSKSVIKRFNYAIVQNKGNSDGCRRVLLQIVPHAFSEHENCMMSWCRFVKIIGFPVLGKIFKGFCYV